MEIVLPEKSLSFPKIFAISALISSSFYIFTDCTLLQISSWAEWDAEPQLTSMMEHFRNDS